MDYERIVAHGDFDGVLSAALCSFVHGVDSFFFTSPSVVERSEVSITERDIVCDLPYPLVCGLWFDHHAGSREALALRGIDPSLVPGRLDEKAPSCARVVFEFYSAERELPSRFQEAVAEADIIDSFGYGSLEEWRRETPGKILDMSLKAKNTDRRGLFDYPAKLAGLLRDLPMEEVASDPEVSKRAELYRGEELKMMDIISKTISYLPEDKGHELAVLDFTNFTRPPRVHKNLAYIVAPQALGVLVLSPVFRNERKTNDISVAISLSMNLAGHEHGKDLGEMMRIMGIGTGHIGAAAGLIHCDTKEAMLRAKSKFLSEIWRNWKKDRSS